MLQPRLCLECILFCQGVLSNNVRLRGRLREAVPLNCALTCCTIIARRKSQCSYKIPFQLDEVLNWGGNTMGLMRNLLSTLFYGLNDWKWTL